MSARQTKLALREFPTASLPAQLQDEFGQRCGISSLPMEFVHTAAMELIGTMNVLRLDIPGRAAAFHGCPSGAAGLSFVLRPQLHTICRELCVFVGHAFAG